MAKLKSHCASNLKSFWWHFFYVFFLLIFSKLDTGEVKHSEPGYLSISCTEKAIYGKEVKAVFDR